MNLGRPSIQKQRRDCDILESMKESSIPTTVADISARLNEAGVEEFRALERALSADPRKGVRQAVERARRRLEAQEVEVERTESLYRFQERLARCEHAVGLDEVGRGPVAGPLTVAAVVLPASPRIVGLNDSKQLSPHRREELAETIKRTALAWSICHIQPEEIDSNGMAASLRAAFSAALADIDRQIPDISCALLDGNALHLDPREVNVVKGDATSASIAAASIVAKVDRDAIMREYAREYPEYGFERNKGYASAEHISAIEAHGLSPVHRASFCTAWTQQSLF